MTRLLLVPLLALHVFFLGGTAAQAQVPAELVRFQDRQARFSILHPKHWRVERPGGPTRLAVAEPAGGGAFLLCTVEHAAHSSRLPVAQARLDRDLVSGFRSREWPQELAGKAREVLDWQVREVNGVPMGAVEWQRADAEATPPRFARGIKLFRFTPAGLWSAECASIALEKPIAEAHFGLNVTLVGDILGSVRFPR